MAPDNLLTMDEAISALATTRGTFNRWLRAGRLKGFKVGRQWRFEKSEIDRFLKGGEPSIDLPVSPSPLISALLDAIGDPELSQDEPKDAARIVSLMLICTLRKGAMAQYVDLVTLEDGTSRGAYSLRIDGLVHRIVDYDSRLHQPIVDQIKKRASMDLAERRVPQDGLIRMQFTAEKRIDIYANTMPTLTAESCCLTIRDPASATMPLPSLGVDSANEARIAAAMQRSHGLFVVGGLSQSGKTVTAYSLLHRLVESDSRVMSIEEPPFMTLPGVIQTQVNWRVGLGFDELIRGARRQYWDTLYISEIKKAETLALALESALLGRVITTVHMKDAISGLINIGASAAATAEALALVTSQRLVRRLCQKCRRPHEPDSKVLALINSLAVTHNQQVLQGNYFEPVGCDACFDGYAGRIGLYETLIYTNEIAQSLAAGAGYDKLQKLAISQGMHTLCMDGFRKAAEGITSVAEVRRATSDLLAEEHSDS